MSFTSQRWIQKQSFSEIDIMKTTRLNNYRIVVLRGEADRRKWKQRLSHTRRFIHPFQGPLPGPTHWLEGQGTELDYFYQIFDPRLIANMTRQTNRYARQRRRQNENEMRDKWEPVTVPEMKAFIGILIIFGCVWQPEIDLYFAKYGGTFGQIGRASCRERV